MLRFDLPDDAGEEQIERFLATLHEQARGHVRQMLAEGASEDEIAEYVQSVDQTMAEEEEAGFEESEPHG